MNRDQIERQNKTQILNLRNFFLNFFFSYFARWSLLYNTYTQLTHFTLSPPDTPPTMSSVLRKPQIYVKKFLHPFLMLSLR
jgi:hypothetical protein